jgi:S-DNA-T family DNA segregation ATPase FtsK/SpoIIIE
MSNWLSSMFGSIGTFFILACSLFLILMVRVDNFIPWLKRIFSGKPKEKAVPTEAEPEDNETSNLIRPKEVISKKINEHDLVETVFDPDLDDLEIDGRIDVSEAGKHVQEQLTGIQAAHHNGPEMTVEKIEEELDEEFVSGETMEAYDPTLDLSNYKFPPIDLLDDHPSGNAEVSNEELISNKNKIVETLRHYKIEITKIRYSNHCAYPGPGYHWY